MTKAYFTYTILFMVTEKSITRYMFLHRGGERMYHPLDETHLVLRGFVHQEVSPKCISWETSTERRSYNRPVKGSPQL